MARKKKRIYPIKKCKLCGKRKDTATEYYQPRDSYCKECSKNKNKTEIRIEQNKAWKDNNKPKISEYYKKWYKENGRKRKPTTILQEEYQENDVWW